MTTFEKPENWDSMVWQVNSVDAFRGVSRAVFDHDGIVTPQRLMVLETFARDVGQAHPQISREVMQHFNKMWACSESTYKWLCWSKSKYDTHVFLKDVIEFLVSIFL